jgi:hypothetical protein
MAAAFSYPKDMLDLGEKGIQGFPHPLGPILQASPKRGMSPRKPGKVTGYQVYCPPSFCRGKATYYYLSGINPKTICGVIVFKPV